MGNGPGWWVLATAWLGTGCLFPAPEKFSEPQRTAPIVALGEVVPPVERFIRVNGPTRVNLDVPFRSSDAGEQVQALLFLDYNTPREQFIDFRNGGASTLEVDRKVTFDYRFNNLTCTEAEVDNVRDVACCHQLTLHLLHESNVDQSQGVSRPRADALGDLTSVVWWMAVEAPGTSPDLLGKCPSPLDEPPDAGRD